MAHFRTREVGGIDRQGQVAPVREQRERLRKLGTGPEIGSHLNVDHRNAPERQALASVLLGQIGRFECDAVELLFVAGVYVRRDQIDQLALRLECPEYVRGLVPQPLEQLFGRFAGRIESCAANVVFRVTRIGEQPLEEAVESRQRSFPFRVAEPHRRPDAFGYGFLEQRGFGRFELGSRQIVQIDVRPSGNQLVYHVEVVFRRVAGLGLDFRQRDLLAVLRRGVASFPARRRVFLQDVARALPRIGASWEPACCTLP